MDPNETPKPIYTSFAPDMLHAADYEGFLMDPNETPEPYYITPLAFKAFADTVNFSRCATDMLYAFDANRNTMPLSVAVAQTIQSYAQWDEFVEGCRDSGMSKKEAHDTAHALHQNMQAHNRQSSSVGMLPGLTSGFERLDHLI